MLDWPASKYFSTNFVANATKSSILASKEKRNVCQAMFGSLTSLRTLFDKHFADAAKTKNVKRKQQTFCQVIISEFTRLLS